MIYFLCACFLTIDRRATKVSFTVRQTDQFTKLQALVYDILPSTTAVYSYAIGSRKLSANAQFLCVFFVVGAQTVVSVLQTLNSYRTRRVIYSQQQSLHQHK